MRHETELAANLRKLTAAAYSAVQCGGTDEEIDAAVEAGRTEARESQARIDAALNPAA